MAVRTGRVVPLLLRRCSAMNRLVNSSGSMDVLIMLGRNDLPEYSEKAIKGLLLQELLHRRRPPGFFQRVLLGLVSSS